MERNDLIDQTIFDDLDKLRKETQDLLSDMRRAIAKINADVVRLLRENNEVVKNCLATAKATATQTKNYKSTMENVEDTLLNVLVAIRQNEYLQAWYPPQKGHPAMKVIGTHPLHQKESAQILCALPT